VTASEKLISIIPKPRVNLVRYFGVFSANSKYRSGVVPSVKGKPEASQEKRKKYWIPWSELLRRTFQIDVTKCLVCGCFVKVISVIKDPAIVCKILRHLGLSTVPPVVARGCHQSARSPGMPAQSPPLR